MQKIFIDKEHIFEVVRLASVKVPENAHLSVRCIDGRYENSPSLPVFTFPGADAGEFLLAASAANGYGFEIDRDKVFEALSGVVGGITKLRFHTDEHAASAEPLKGCGHIGQMEIAPNDYGVTVEDITYIKSRLNDALSQGAIQTTLHGDHNESVIVLVKGPYGVLPQTDITIDNRRHHVQSFVYHQSLADLRHQIYARELLKAQAVTLPRGCDEEYLYQVFAEVSEDHLMETLKRLAKGLPIYEVVFSEDGLFEIEDMGFV